MHKGVVAVVLLASLLIGGCESDRLKEQNDRLFMQLSEADKRVADLMRDQADLSRLKEELSGLQSELERSKSALQDLDEKKRDTENEMSQYRDWITAITELKGFQYEIISPSIDREPHDKVVYIRGVPAEIGEQTVYLLKAALVFSDDGTERVTFWRDRDRAILYRDGKYDAEEGPLGWSGFDYRFGAIRNGEQPPQLIQYNSRDDSQLVDFGKYSSSGRK